MSQLRLLLLSRNHGELMLLGKKRVEVHPNSRYTRAIEAGDPITFITDRTKVIAQVAYLRTYAALAALWDKIGSALLGFGPKEETYWVHRKMYAYNGYDSHQWRACSRVNVRPVR